SNADVAAHIYNSTCDDIIGQWNILHPLGCLYSLDQFNHPIGAWLKQVFLGRIGSLLTEAL
ncbi:hypothetical protein SK128_009682, partial [Halocaridina rubra]